MSVFAVAKGVHPVFRDRRASIDASRQKGYSPGRQSSVKQRVRVRESGSWPSMRMNRYRES